MDALQVTFAYVKKEVILGWSLNILHTNPFTKFREQNMSDFKKIYTTQAEQYDRLIAREDYQGNIISALQKIRPFSQQTIVEFGAGTGRLTCLLAPLVTQIHAFDDSSAMLAVARQKLMAFEQQNWQLQVADNAHIPLPDNCADMTIEGWSFGHLRGWHPDSWQEKLDTNLSEMERLLRPNGTMILLETLGTGYESPHRFPELDELFLHLETTHQFQHTWIRTDYQFASLDEAEQLTRFFFGDELAQQVRQHSWIILPECTGIWWKALNI